MAVCCQNLPLGALSSRSASFVLVGELFKKFSLFLTQVYDEEIYKVPGYAFFPRPKSLSASYFQTCSKIPSHFKLFVLLEATGQALHAYKTARKISFVNLYI
jgi:hypothetical protein